MHNIKLILLYILTLHTLLYANITGVVYTDYNLNGIKDKSDLPLSGIKIDAYCTDHSKHQTYTDKNGIYTINNLAYPDTKCRIEASTQDSSLYPAVYAINNTSPLVDITTNNTQHDISFISSEKYCQNRPDVIVAAYPLYQDNNYTKPQEHGTLFKIPTPPNHKFVQDINLRKIIKIRKQLGAIWGLAYDKYHKTIYASSVLMRYVPLSDKQAGTIYKITDDGNLSTVINLGNQNVGIKKEYFPRDLHKNQDRTIMHLIGRAGLGDLDISEDGRYLYTVNLWKKTLVKIDLTTNQYKSIPIPNPYNNECNASKVRPWALKTLKNDVYIGSVCEDRIEDGIGAVIQKFSDNNFSTIAKTNSLRYLRPRGYNPTLPTKDVYQNSNWADTKHINYPQPILTDIEFTNIGNLVLGYSDRAAYMKQREGSHGDIRKMCLNKDGTYTDESTDVAQTSCSSHEIIYKNNPEKYFEFYIGDYYTGYLGEDNHPETAMGSLAVRLGNDSIYIGMVDGTNLFEAGSIGILSNQTGDKIAAQALIDPNSIKDKPYGEREIYGSKSGGIGDIEILCDPLPIEIGNYVWIDLNKNGIQDPDEPPFSNINVQLYHNNIKIGEASTDHNGHYYFGGVDNVNLYKNYTLLSEANYTLIIDKNSTFDKNTSIVDVSDNHYDSIDNDAISNEYNHTINLTTTTHSNHTYDFGILPTYGCLDIQIFEDLDEDGIFNNDDKLAPKDIKLKILSSTQKPISVTTDQNGSIHLENILVNSKLNINIYNLNPIQDYDIEWTVTSQYIKIKPKKDSKTCQHINFSYHPTWWQSIKNLWR